MRLPKWICLLPVVVLTSPAIYGSDPGADDQRASVTVAPVLKKSEPVDSVVFRLPGAAPAAGAALPATEVHLAPPLPDPERPVLRRPKPELPPDFEENSGEFLAKQIGVWQKEEAQDLLGDAVRLRPAYADEQTVNGQILAFPDPTGRYKEVELDFDQDTGLLRTLFFYPQGMKWDDCRKAYGANVRATQANKGRTFYSYLDRKLDVLVDASGRVISLGMY